ncbi:MAG: Dethiobiotin synthetase [Cyanobacteria bacterium SID2]|nr:Dethiobiotin synthetase [Cyanobacteria bacterium SID2]MBP0005656.1 Dethiobiotin synthetase [Cyanobacteria bacterium SBC]
MDEQTARNFLISQGRALETQRNPDAFLMLLQQGKAPIPGQMTSILLALKMLYRSLEGQKQIDREIAYALHRLVLDSRRQFDAGRNCGVSWPPLLAEDLDRLERAVQSIFLGDWSE